MPLTRYQIRDEYSLADPELYGAADRDDPEALLEGVAMAGLVGVLRQLGDLAEFAAEIFHDLHEEVMATAARGHGLMVRVQQLEAEVPSIEKAFLSQTSHSLFFSNAGVDWHPNLHAEQNLVTRGDLPRFVMDSYEECRGPPRLFLLDKFDVAGAGACLKRYTDPSFFKVEPASFGAAKTEGQREKRIRKVKKKGSRWRNGETPEVQPPSHAKLQQLFLEERVENGYGNPSCLVKLKRRHLNGSPFDSKTGKSYMEKFLEPSTPKQKVLHEISVPSPLKLTLDNSSEPGLEILEISMVSPAKKSSQGEGSACSSPNEKEVVSIPYREKFNGDVIDGKIMKVPEPADLDTNDISSSTLHKVAFVEELAVDGELKTEGSADGYHSEDLTSEIDNYMDALTTMDSEMETENEYRTKNNGLLIAKNRGRNSDGDEENLEFQAHSSDSQSFGNSPASDYGNGSIKCNRSSFSDSDTLSSSAENATSGGDGAAKVFLSSEPGAAKGVDRPSSRLTDESQGTRSHELVVPYDSGIEEDKTPDLGEASCSSCLTDSSPALLPSDHGVHSPPDVLVGPEVEEATSDSIEVGSRLSYTDENGANRADGKAFGSDGPSKTLNDIRFVGSAENHLDGEDPNAVSNVLLHLSDVLGITPENKGTDHFPNDVLQTESADEDYSENLVDGKIVATHLSVLPNLSVLPTEKQQLCSFLPEVEVHSDVIPTICSSDGIEPYKLISKADNARTENGINLENSTPLVETQKSNNLEQQKLSDLTNIVPELELASVELDDPYTDEQSDFDKIPRAAEGEEIMGTSTCCVDAVGGDAVPLKLPYTFPNYTCHEDHINLDSVETEQVIADVSLSTAAITGADNDSDDCIHPCPDLASRNHIKLQEPLSEFPHPHPKGTDCKEVDSPENLTETEAQDKVNLLEVSPADTPCKLVSSDHCNLKTVAGDDESSLAEETQYTSCGKGATPAPTYSAPGNQHLESNSPHQSHLLENSEAELCLPIGGLPGPGDPKANSLQFESDEVSLQEYEATCNSSRLQSGQIQSQNHTDHERCEQLQSLNHLEKCVDPPPPESHSEYLPCQPSESEFLLRSSGLELGVSKLAMDPLESALPSFGLLPQAAHVNLEEVPPLPPLPPMQWRMGKTQIASLASPRYSIEASQHSFPPLQPFADEKAQFGFPASQTRILQHQNPYFPITTVEDEKSQQVSEQSMDNLAQLIPFSLQLQTIASDADSQSNYLSLGGTQTPFLTSPSMPNERPEYGVLALDGEKAHLNSIPFTPMPTIEYTTCRHDPESSLEKPIEPSQQLGPETGSVDKELQPTLHYYSEEELQNPFDMSMPPPTVEAEQCQRALLTSDGETPQVEGVEVGKPNGNLATKLPRPPKPLIDAVAAHDKSKLRKVAERVRPRVERKIDERDSLLEQIRTKSFNLKPAVVTRPSMHGPQTNLKVAAILEKAKTIRQAFAGSDEDDDSDNWSDA
ncbi:protein SCAR2-like [Juglans regia]|uniref:Protein SCAR n=1 Tax=Juglans regia TaxID=51240 RepID=A0A6P9EA02_JUGRE|nr:protein SCAR2-like [Juglans regia]